MNYLAELYGLKNLTGALKVDRNINYTVNGEEYRDPDSESLFLYRKWEDFFKGKRHLWQAYPTESNILVNVDRKEFILGSDYIGPSKYWTALDLFNSGKDEDTVSTKMQEILNETRKFKGHIVWPRMIDGMSLGYSTINMARGGRKGVYDRFDITLYLLSKYYPILEDKYSPKDFCMRFDIFVKSCDEISMLNGNKQRLFNMFTAFELSSDWLKLFGTFEGFIEFFDLKIFLNEAGEVELFRPENLDGSSSVVIDFQEGYADYAVWLLEKIKER